VKGMTATDDGEDPKCGHGCGNESHPSHNGVLVAGSMPRAFEAGDEGVKREGVEEGRHTNEDGVNNRPDV